jgi:hypothetical protein|tara:strand:+ start:3514 stop:3963 length:450 start_codon:yes stop_codon:yes gene_type:complete
MAKLPNNPLVSELFKAVHGKKTAPQKVALLKEHKRDDVKALLIWNFDKGIDSAVPEGDVPYKKNDAPAGTEGHTRLIHEWRTLYNFVRGGNDGISNMRRETLLIQLLESLQQDEAEIVCLVKDKALQSKYRITRSVVEQAYPEIVWRDK